MDLAFLVEERPDGSLGADDALLGAEIEHLRPGPFLRLPDRERLLLDDVRDLARGIVEISKDAALSRADDHAGGQQLVLDAVRAEVALLGRPGVWIDEELIVRARLHARAASDAVVRVQIDDTVAAPEQGVRRADSYAWRVDALVAQDRKEEALRLRERALLDGLDPAAIHPNRNVVFSFTGDRAGVT